MAPVLPDNVVVTSCPAYRAPLAVVGSPSTIRLHDRMERTGVIQIPPEPNKERL